MLDEEEGRNPCLELLQLLQCQSLLLRFCREVREQLHCCKANQTRLRVWVALKEQVLTIHEEQQRQVAKQKASLKKIQAQLPRNPSQYFVAGTLAQRVRISLTRSARTWIEGDSIKLRDVVADAFKLELGHLLPQIPTPHDLITPEQLALLPPVSNLDLLLQTLQTCLHWKQDNQPPPPLTGVRFSVENFWKDFWDTVAEAFADKPVRSGRDCQIHWTYNHHPNVNRSTQWSKAEEKQLIRILQKVGGGKWDVVAEQLGTNRPSFDVYSHYQTALNVGLTSSEWSPEEVERLRESVEKYECQGATRLWSQVSLNLSNKTSEQCRLKYASISKIAPCVRSQMATFQTELKHGVWSVEEDVRLQILTHLVGRGNWARIADFMPQRTAAKCRERFENKLAPDLTDKEEWAPDENDKLLQAVEFCGHRNWTVIKRFLAGRTDAECAKQWARLNPIEKSLSSIEGAAAVMCIPSQARKRRTLPALETNDFGLVVVSQIKSLLDAALQVAQSNGYKKVKRRRGRPPKSEASGQTKSRVLRFAEATHSERELRLSVLHYYLSRVVTGTKQADRRISEAKTLTLEVRAFTLGVPPEVLKALPPLASEQRQAIDSLLALGFTVDDIAPCTVNPLAQVQPKRGEGPQALTRFLDNLLPNAAQALLRLIAVFDLSADRELREGSSSC